MASQPAAWSRDHGDYAQCLFVGHASAFDHLRFDSKLFLHLARQRSSSVDEYFRPVQSCEVAAELRQQSFVVHDVSAYLDYFDHNLYFWFSVKGRRIASREVPRFALLPVTSPLRSEAPPAHGRGRPASLEAILLLRHE